MSLCPKCCGRLVKRKADMSWNCRRHGTIRYINTPPVSSPPKEKRMTANYLAMLDPDTWIPENLREGFKLWVEHGILPGSFATAVLVNDLAAACMCSDQESHKHLRTISRWLRFYAPEDCWGSREATRSWAETKKPKITIMSVDVAKCSV